MAQCNTLYEHTTKVQPVNHSLKQVRTPVVCPLERDVPNSKVVHTQLHVVGEGGSGSLQ